MHVIAGKAVAFGEALKPEFQSYSAQVLKNASTLAATLMEEGLSLVSGGTDNHLMLIDLSEGDVSGKDAEIALGAAGITVNKNTVPRERRSPFVTSGVRIGAPAITTRGFKEAECRWVGQRIAEVIRNPDDAERALEISQEVKELCTQFPVYPHLYTRS